MAKKRKPPKLPGGGKTFANVQNTVNEHTLRYQRNFARQFVYDAAILAARDTFGAGERRMQDFMVSLDENLMKMAELTLEDAKDDKSCEYMKAKLDEALEPLMGDRFRPYDERYRL